jgi:SAM-dependent methyltransferase
LRRGNAANDRIANPVASISPLEAVFAQIYRDNVWQNAESRSGHGSTIERTVIVREALAALIDELGIRTLLDAPCGDFNWLKEVPLPNTHYLGVDVVPEMIERNRRLYGNERREFRVLDITADPLPAVDLLFCRDGLVHLSNADAQMALAAFRRSASRYLLATTFTQRTANDDIPTGHWRPINLEQAPFLLPPPVRALSDGCPIPEYADKALGLWRIEHIPDLRYQCAPIGDSRP